MLHLNLVDPFSPLRNKSYPDIEAPFAPQNQNNIRYFNDYNPIDDLLSYHLEQEKSFHYPLYLQGYHPKNT